MATVNEEEKDPQQNPAGGPVPIAGTGGASAQGGAGAAAPVSPVAPNTAPTGNQGYTDVSSYLDANKAGADAMGQQVAGKLTDTYNTTKGGIDTSYNSLIDSVNQGYTPQDSAVVAKAASDPVAAAADPNTLTGFTGQLNDTYTGPSNWADLGTQEGNVAQAQQKASLPSAPGGLGILLQDVEGPTASQGVNQLDSLLLGGSPTALTTIKAATDPFATLTNYLDTDNTNATSAIGTAQTTANTAAQNARDALTGPTGTLTNINSSVTDATGRALTDAQAQQNRIKAELAGIYNGVPVDATPASIGAYGGGTTPWYNSTNYDVNSGAVSPADLAALGVSPDQWAQLVGSLKQAGTSTYEEGHNFGAPSPTSQLDLMKYLSQNDPNTLINAGTVASPEEYAKTSAIQQLLGGTLPNGTVLNPALASLAGTYNPKQLDSFNYNAALHDANTTSQKEIQAAKDEAEALTDQADSQHAASMSGSFFDSIAPFLANPPLALGNVTTDWASKQARK